MNHRVDPSFLSELQQYGAVDIEKCFNCGNCTAVCPLSSDETPFPRNSIRLLQLGLKDRLQAGVDPWLCYYCGECSDTCPRQAEPAEAQMAMRRWLIARYDWTGLARRFYTSKWWEVGALVVVAAFVTSLFVFLHGPIVTDRVALTVFAPVHAVHTGDLIMAGLLSFFLLSNVFRMWWITIRQDPRVEAPITLYITEAWNLLWHFLSQERLYKCDHKQLWLNHWILVTGYVLMFTMIVMFLGWFQTDNIYPLGHPQRWLGYYATAALLWGAGAALWGRIRRQYQLHRFSHLSDWIFPILLILTAITGILVHAFRYAGLPITTYVTYVIHMAIAVPMLVIEVPFGKWAHLAYRPFAIYFQAVREKAMARREVGVEALAPV
jgi:ferredoxin